MATSSFKVLDVKYTRPSNLSQQMHKYRTNLCISPVWEIEPSTTIVTKRRESNHDSSKRKIYTSVRNKADHGLFENSLCETLKKLRLDSNDESEQQVYRVYHSDSCRLTNQGCCTVQQNFGGSCKTLEVDKEKLKLSKIPIRVPATNAIGKEPPQSKIPIRIPRQVANKNGKTTEEKWLTKRKGASKERSSDLMKSCMKSETKASPYLHDIMNTFGKTEKKVTFSDFVEDTRLKTSLHRKRQGLVTKAPQETRILSLPPWRY